jgi:hypothetical protein
MIDRSCRPFFIYSHAAPRLVSGWPIARTDFTVKAVMFVGSGTLLSYRHDLDEFSHFVAELTVNICSVYR